MKKKQQTYGKGLHHFYVSYRIITEFLQINVILSISETEHGDTVTDELKRNAEPGISRWLMLNIKQTFCGCYAKCVEMKNVGNECSTKSQVFALYHVANLVCATIYCSNSNSGVSR